MTKIDEWFIYIEDHDRRNFSIVGPMRGKFIGDWVEAIACEQERGRALACREVATNAVAENRSHAVNNGFSEVESPEIIPTPKDRSNHYVENLPAYASSADRSLIVHILCKGRCGRTRLARLNKPYPGPNILKNAIFGEYLATCLKCDDVASDNYNWHR